MSSELDAIHVHYCRPWVFPEATDSPQKSLISRKLPTVRALKKKTVKESNPIMSLPDIYIHKLENLHNLEMLAFGTCSLKSTTQAKCLLGTLPHIAICDKQPHTLFYQLDIASNTLSQLYTNTLV